MKNPIAKLKKATKKAPKPLTTILNKKLGQLTKNRQKALDQISPAS